METVTAEKMGFSSTRLERIRQVMQRLVDEGRFAGIQTLISRKGQVVHFENVGMRDLAAGKLITDDTLFRIYSMTKPITSVAVMMLYEAGYFRLVDPISAFLPEFKDIQVAKKGPDGQWQLVPPLRPVTIHDLLTHTGGLSYGEDPDHYADQVFRQKVEPLRTGRGEHALRDFVRGVAATPLHHQPGQQYLYSISTDVLGRLVEVAAGQPFANFLHSRIFDPLGMPDTFFSVPPEKLDRFACMYGPVEEDGLPVPGKLKNIDPLETSSYLHPDRLPGGGGGLVSTIADYLRFCQMLLNGGELEGVRLLGRKTVDLMRMNHLPEGKYTNDETREHGFGLGGYVLLHPERARANGSSGNWGWGGAANTFFWIDFVEQLIPIIMVQYMPFSPFVVEDTFKNLVYQALI